MANGASRLTTIRGRIAVASVVVAVITAGLGGFAVTEMERAEALVTSTYDRSLMSINYARAAAREFSEMHAFFARAQVEATPETRSDDATAVVRAERAFGEDLQVAVERARSEQARDAGAQMRVAVEGWTAVRDAHGTRTWTREDWKVLDGYGTQAEAATERFINLVAGDGYKYRQRAVLATSRDRALTVAGTGVALVLAGLVAWLLARRIIRPLAEASRAARRIADGDLSGTVPTGGADEVGALLDAMEVMRRNIGTMVENEKHLRANDKTRIADAMESSREGFVVVDADGVVAMANSQAGTFAGAGISAGERIAGVIAGLDAEGRDAEVLLGAPLHGHETAEIRLATGNWLRVSRTRTTEGGYVVVSSDITLEVERKERLAASNADLDAAFANMNQGLCLVNADGRLRLANRRFSEILGFEAGTVVPGMAFEDVVRASILRGNHAGSTAEELVANLGADGREGGRAMATLTGGRLASVSHTPMAEGGMLISYEDATDRMEAERRISHMATHDALTGLPNRVLLNERLEAATSRIDSEKGFSLFYLDLDRFKQVNDTLGHPVGDELLKQVAGRLKGCVRDRDTVARLGGDEFAVILGGGCGPRDAGIIASRVVAALAEPFLIDGDVVSIGTSIGITMAPADGVSATKLLKNADMALYKAKAEGRSTWRFFETAMDAKIQQRRLVETELRDAIATGQFELHYQPLLDIASDAISGCEALVRWNHPTRGMVMPGDFIQLAEEIGAIEQLGGFVLRKACEQAVTWKGRHRIAVNVSAVQLRDGTFPAMVAQTLGETGCDPRWIELEITESTVMSHDGEVLQILRGLHDIGVRIALDDFGTGFSSLSYLNRFPFDKIKIDRSFLSRDLEEAEAGQLVKAIIAIGKALNLRVTAEGVETAAQLDWLRAAGCDEAQGYHVARPAPAARMSGGGGRPYGALAA